MMLRRVAVIGGGIAGIAAALSLADQGFAVSLIERRPFLGGRAFSFDDPVFGSALDNGQHALLGCYRETLAFLLRIGAQERLHWQGGEWVEIREGDSRGVLASGSVGAPFHLARALLGYRLLSRREQLLAMMGALRVVVPWRSRPDCLDRYTVEEALIAAGQSERVRRRLWDPLALATLNEDPRRACAALFAAVIWRAFFGRRRDATIVLPAVPLSELFGEPSRTALARAGVALELGEKVESIGLDGGTRTAGGAWNVRLRGGRRIESDAVILALPPRRIAELKIGERSATNVLGPWLDRLVESVPIVSTHVPLAAPAPRLPEIVGLLGTTTQWIFNTDRIRSDGGRSQGHLSCVTSGARALEGWDDRRIAEQVASEIERHVPEVSIGDRRRIRVVRERHATMAPTIAANAARPSSATRIPGLYLAGDWVQTGLPATIESAVMSARLAVSEVKAVFSASAH